MKLLAAVDLSRATAYVMESVHRVAMATDAEVHLVHVIMPLPTLAGVEFPPVMGQKELSERYLDEQDQLAELVSELADIGVNATSLMAQGDPAKSILREAERLEVELIVVGSHGHGPLFEALVGSVSSDVLRHSPVPVLVVPTRDI